MGETYRTSDKKAWIGWKGLPSYVPEYNFVDGFWLGAKFETGLKLSEASTLQFTPSCLLYTSQEEISKSKTRQV